MKKSEILKEANKENPKNVINYLMVESLFKKKIRFINNLRKGNKTKSN